MIVNYWRPLDNKVTPDQVAKKSVAEGFYKCNGTHSDMFSAVGQKYYGLDTYVTKNWNKAKSLLKQNKPLIAYTHPTDNGHFSKKSGHYVIFSGFNSSNKTVEVKDPYYNTTSLTENDAKKESDTWFYFVPGEKFDIYLRQGDILASIL